MDIKTRRQKQQKLMVKMVERKVRSRAEQLYNQRGKEEGQALEDWVQAESEVVGKSILAPLYHRMRNANPDAPEPATEAPAADSSARETSA
ncbi:MAG: DUF2934 domain-containing protein [Candidatus Sulfotelmatobacter sp.]